MKREKKRVTFEAYLFVQDLVKKDDDSYREAFERAEDVRNLALKLPSNIKCLNKELSRFDSSNISHATAYYDVTLEGTANAIRKYLIYQWDYEEEMADEVISYNEPERVRERELVQERVDKITEEVAEFLAEKLKGEPIWLIDSVIAKAKAKIEAESR